MAFDIGTAKPVEPQQQPAAFDPTTAATVQEMDQPAVEQESRPILGGLETAATVATGAVAELGGGLTYLPALAAGGPDAAQATKEGVSRALTYRPRTRTGGEYLDKLSVIGQFFEWLQDRGSEGGVAFATGLGAEEGSPAAGVGAAAGSIVPDAAAALLGVRPAARAGRVDTPTIPARTTPPPTPEPTVAQVTENIRGASKDGVLNGGTRRRSTEALVEQVQPDTEVTGALRDVGIAPETVPAEVVSGSTAFRQAAGAARSVPASPLATRYRDFLDTLSRTADELKAKAGANDIGSVNYNVERNLTDNIDRARQVENSLYTEVDQLVETQFGKSATVDTTPIYDRLLSELDSVGGDVSKLSGAEKRLFARFVNAEKDAAGNVTYSPRPETWGGITKLRKELNAAGEGKGEFGDAATFEAQEYARLVSETQKVAADTLGIGEQFREALRATGVKKSAQEAAQSLLGSRLDKSFSAVFDTKVGQLSKGRIKEFEDVVQAIPEPVRKEAVTSFVFTKIMDPKNMDARVNVAGFNKWFNELSSNPQAKATLYKYLDPETRRSVEALGKITSAVKRANEDAVKTGLIGSVDEGFKLSESIIGKVMRAGAVGAASAGGGAIAGAGAAAATSAKGSKGLSQAASDLLADPAFQSQVANKIRNADANTMLRGEESLSRTPAWRKFFASITPEQRKAIRNVGITAWLISSNDE